MGGDIDPLLKDVELKDELTKGKWLGLNALELSVGQQQRIGIARALFLGREVIILDESLANVDRQRVEAIKKNLSKKKDETIIFVSHHIDKDDPFFDEIIDLEKIS